MSAMVTEAMVNAAVREWRRIHASGEAADIHQAMSAALAAALSTEPGEAEGWQPTHRHRTRGSTYRVIGTANLQTSFHLADIASLSDMTSMVVYQAEDGHLWVRPHAEFFDGRFEALPAAPLPEDTHHG